MNIISTKVVNEFDEIWWRGEAWPEEESIFGGDPDSPWILDQLSGFFTIRQYISANSKWIFVAFLEGCTG